MTEKMVGVIGGSGLYEMEGLEEVQTVSLTTPFGNPSDSIVVGRLEGTKIACPVTEKAIASNLPPLISGQISTP